MNNKVATKSPAVEDGKEPAPVEDTKEPDTPSIADLLAQDKEEEGLDISPAVLEKAKLDLPGDYLLESMADELLGHLTNYHQAKAGYRTARASGDHQKAEQLYKVMSYSRLAAALIQDEYPGAKDIADKIAVYRVEDIKKNRAALEKKLAAQKGG